MAFEYFKWFQGKSKESEEARRTLLDDVQGIKKLLSKQSVLIEEVRFDPGVHEAVANRSPGAPSLEVVEVVQPGYLQDGKVVRAAKVIVGAAGAPTRSEGGTGGS